MYQNLSLVNAKTPTEGIGKFSQQNFEGISELVDFLKFKDIRYIYAVDFIKWKVLFESKEEVIASCYYLCPCMTYNMPPYNDMVNNAERYGYVFFNDSGYNERLINYLNKNNINYNVKEFKAVNVYYGFSRDARPNIVFSEWDLFCD